MDATPILSRIAAALNESRLEAVLVGNAAAALNGAPVTTMDFDFMVRDMDLALRKLRHLAQRLESKRAAARPKDKAVLEIIEATLEEQNRNAGEADP